MSDIYNEVKALDDVWSEEIPDGDYVRVVFEVPLTSDRDITVYPRIVDGTPRIEVYEVDGTDLIAEFDSLTSNQYNKVFLTNLQGTQDTFDLRVVGGSVEFDHIIDPAAYLWVDGFTGEFIEWTSEVGDSPYLNATDGTSYIQDNADDTHLEGNFTFEDSNELGVINDVEIRIYSRNDNNDDGDIVVYITNSTGEQNVVQFEPLDTGYSWTNTSILATLPTWAEINSAQMRLLGIRDGGADILSVDAALIYVDYTAQKPQFDTPAINESEVFVNKAINHTISISGSPPVDGYIFSWNGTSGCSGGWSNSSWIDVSGSTTAWNVSTPTTGCEGKTIGWRFYANNTAGWNNSAEQIYDVLQYGTLNVSISLPTDDSNFNQGDTNLTVNATITCSGGAGAACGTVSALARYNLTASPDTAINTTAGATPFYISGGGSEQDSKGRIKGSTHFEDEELIAGVGTEGVFIYEWNETSEDYYQVTNATNVFTAGISVIDAGNVTPDGAMEIVMTGADSGPDYLTKVYNYSDGTLTYVTTLDAGVFQYYGLAIGQYNTSSGVEEIILDDQSTSDRDYVEVWMYTGTTIENYMNQTRDDGGGVTNTNFWVALEDINDDGGDDAILHVEVSSIDWFQVYDNDSYVQLGNYTVGNMDSTPDDGDFADFDGDDILDKVYVGSDSNVSVSNASFEQIFNENVAGASCCTQSVAIGDFNKDTCWDIAAGDSGSGGTVTIGVFEGNCDGTFSTIKNITIGGDPTIQIQVMDSTDIDGDGYDEIYLLADSGSTTEIFVTRYNASNPSDPYYNSHNITVTNTGGESSLALEAYDIDLDSEAGGGANPQSSPSTLEDGEAWNVSWQLNVSSASAESYLLDVEFNSSYGNSSVQENDTENRKVNLNPVVDTDAPQWFDNSTNDTTAGASIEHRVRWTDAGLSGYIFSFDNGTGTFVNDSFVAMTGTNNWSNVSKIVNSTEGATIRWIVYANDTASPSNWNSTDIFQYDTTGGPITSCQALDTTGATYTLQNNITNESTSYCMNISADGVTLDCQGYTIEGNGSADYGIYVNRASQYSTNITIKDCIVSEWDTYGIYIEKADRNNISDTIVNRSTNSDYGIRLRNSDYNIITNVTTSGFQMGLWVFYSDKNIIENSTFENSSGRDVYNQGDCDNLFTNVNGTGNKPIAFYNDSVTIENWNNNVSQISLCDADNSVLNNITLACDPTFTNNGIDFFGVDSTNISNTNLTSCYRLSVDEGGSNIFTNITMNNNDMFLVVGNSNHNIINNLTSIDNGYGIYLLGVENNTIVNSTFKDSLTAGIMVFDAGDDGVGPNIIYNNLFNNSGTYDNTRIGGTEYLNYWNTTNQTGNRIYGSGTQIGGNYWTNSSGSGYSDTCDDTDSDGFCDDPFNVSSETSCTIGVDCGNNTDYLPLAAGDTTPPKWFDNSTNDTAAGASIEHRVRWTDADLDGYIFSFDNGTGTFANDSWVAMTGTNNWSNVSKIVNSTAGSTIRWRVYANDTASPTNWNSTDIFIYNTTAVDTDAPQWFDNSTNDTAAGESIEHRVRWTDAALDGYIFSFDNGTGTFANDSFVAMTGTNNWSNVSKIVNSTVGSTIRWRVYANDTASPTNWNSTDIFIYNTTGLGTLNVNITLPTDNTNVTQNATFIINATVFCEGGDCGTVSALARYNNSGASADTAINTTAGATPFYILSTGGEPTQEWNISDNNGAIAYGVAVDSSGGVYITGYNGTFPYDYYTVKYNASDGSQLWNVTDSNGNTAYGVAIDSSGGVYITGINDSNDYYTVKYNASTGAEIWNVTDSNGYYAKDVAVDSGGGVYVTGYNGSSPYDYYTVKYNASTGAEIWNVTDSNGEFAQGVAVDSGGGVYVTGYDDSDDYYTVKYNASDGSQLWNVTDTNGDYTMGVAVDSSGGVYVTGYNGTSPYDYYTVKYNASDGSQLWNVTDSNGAIAYGVAVDSSGGVYITGYNGSSPYDYYTVKYSQARNPKTSPQTLEQGESWNVSWTINATGSPSTSYEIDVLFNSTTYPNNITGNDTEDRKVNLNPAGDTDAPQWFDNSTNDTTAGASIEHRVRWTDAGLSG
jgi:parallel beta-helix repeat protein